MCAALVLFSAVLAQAEEEEQQLPELITKTIKEAKTCKRQAKPGDKLQVHYVGRLDDENGKIFDESRPRGSTFNFQLGAGQVSTHGGMDCCVWVSGFCFFGL